LPSRVQQLPVAEASRELTRSRFALINNFGKAMRGSDVGELTLVWRQ
jgi:hypothetical protein